MKKHVRTFGFLLIVLSVMLSCKESSSPLGGFRAPIIKIPGNEFEGTCQDLERWRETVGVQDDLGNGHPRYAGWTDARFRYEFSKLIYSGRSVQKVQCNCNKKIYDDAQVCLKECKVSLGCFTGICAPVSGQVCLKTDSFTVEFNVDAKSYRLEWVPKQNPSSKCLIEKSQWETRVETHEGRHVQDAFDIVKLSNGKWKKPKTYEACAATEDEAKRIINAKIKAELDHEIELMGLEFDKRSSDFHHMLGGSTLIDPDCNICK
jgi:hypothetical protein